MSQNNYLFMLTICLCMKNIKNAEWKGKWFPYSPNDTRAHDADLFDKEHGNKMGIQSVCDTGKPASVDWDDSPFNYMCFESGDMYEPNYHLNALIHDDTIPKEYQANHACVNTSIEYEFDIPTYGNHRPIWAKYGEYTYLPPQRWVHNLEHGAIVMLYHPCANKGEVTKLRNIVKSCLFRHIITPYAQLSHERPLVLVAWSHSLSMSAVDGAIVEDFIKQYSLKSPEAHVSDDGQYSYNLEVPAKIISSAKDTFVCPKNM